jgi:hypothetical protein
LFKKKLLRDFQIKKYPKFSCGMERSPRVGFLRTSYGGTALTRSVWWRRLGTSECPHPSFVFRAGFPAHPTRWIIYFLEIPKKK